MIDPYRMVVINITACLIIGVGLIIFKKLFPKKKINYFILLILISILPLISVLRKGTYESGDLTLHSIFLRSFYENLLQGNLIPQWTGYLCGGYGCPNHIFEYPLPFYISSIFHFFGFSYINSIKMLLAFSFIGSGITMYIWMKSQYSKLSGFTAAIFYLFAPFHLSETHFRISVGMILSFVWIPLVFYFTKKSIDKPEIKYIIVNAFCLSFLVMSHPNIALSVIPVLTGYTLIYSIKKSKIYFENLLMLGASLFLSFLYSSFYILPVMTEVKYTWSYLTQSTNDFKPFWDHFFTPSLFGLLFQGPNGEFYPLMGYAHIAAIFIAIIFLAKNIFSDIDKKVTYYYLLCFFVMFFMLQSISQPVWNNVPLLNTFILPWRLLIPIAFITSVIAGLIITKINNKKIVILIIVFTIGSTILNWGNRRAIPEDPSAYETHYSMYTRFYDKNDPVSVNSAKKMLPNADKIVLKRPISSLEVLNGSAKYKELERSFTKHSYIIYAKTNVKIRENTFYFPGWTIYANEKEIPLKFRDQNNYGIITFELPKGLHIVELKFLDTEVRFYSKLISGFFIAGSIFYILFTVIKKSTQKKQLGYKKRINYKSNK